MNVFRILLWPFQSHAPVRAAPSGDSSRRAPLTLEEYYAIDPVQSVPHGNVDVVYAIPNAGTKWRVDTLFTKEPDTIEWIAGFQPGEVLVDIGANVGMYTIWAAKTRGVKVFAFEPESQNYALLYKNIVLNGLSQQVVAYCAALSDTSTYSMLYLSQFQVGDSCHSFGEKIDHRLEYRASEISQGCISATLDDLVATGVVPVPNHIKIDVDGLEHKVVAGCRSVLADRRLKSILVEINTNLEQHRRIISDLGRLGYTYSDEQVSKALRTEGPFKGVGNHVFRR